MEKKKMTIAAVVLALFLSATSYGLYRVKGMVWRMERFRVDASSIVITNAPRWVDDIAVAAELRRVLFGEDTPIFARDLVVRIRRLTEEGGEYTDRFHWLERVTYVRKKYPSTVEMGLVIRRPVVYVIQEGGYYLVDDTGVRLPERYYRLEEYRLLLIKGIKGATPEPGGMWSDRDALLAGIATVREIVRSGLHRVAKITAVDVSNYGGRVSATESHVVLWTVDNTRILWGRSSRDMRFGDLTTEQKLANLRAALREFGSLRRLEYVDVYTCPGRYPVKYREVE